MFLIHFSKVLTRIQNENLHSNPLLGIVSSKEKFQNTRVNDFIHSVYRHYSHGLTHLNSATRCVFYALVSCFVLKDVYVVWNSPMVRSMQAISRGPSQPLLLSIEYSIDKIYCGCIADCFICLLPRACIIFPKNVLLLHISTVTYSLHIKSNILMIISEGIFSW